MGINANKVKTSGSKNQAEAMEAGNYPCRIAQVIDLGLQPQRAWEGKEKPPANMLMVTYEFTDEFMVDEDGNEMLDKPRWLSEEFPLFSLEATQAKSTARYTALDPNNLFNGDWADLVGMPCMVTITSTPGKGKNVGRTFNNISGVSGMRARDVEKTPDLVNPSKVFTLDDPDLEVFMSLPEWIQEKVKSNLEYTGSNLENLLGSKPAKEEKASEEPDYSAQDDDETPDW